MNVILSIDLNPILKRKYCLEKLEELNYANEAIYGAGGEGIELAFLLKALNEEVFLSGFIGGVNGNHIHKELMVAGLPHEYYPLRDETLDCTIIQLEDRQIIINSKEPRITRDDMGGFIKLYNSFLNDTSLVCCLGNNTFEALNELYFDIIANANIKGIKTLVSLSKDGLKNSLKASPYLVLLEKEDLEEITNLHLDYDYELIKVGLYIIEKGVKVAVISQGKRGSLVLTTDNVFRVSVSEVEKEAELNRGYMLGGFATALSRGYDFEMMLKLGQSCGMVNYYELNQQLDMSHIKRIMACIEVDKFNY